MRMLRPRSHSASLVMIVAVAPLLAHTNPGFAQTSDTTPAGMVGYFTTQSECPAGWTEYAPLQGRLALAVTDTTTYAVGSSVGDPLADETMPTHTHEYKLSVSLGAADLPGTPCSCCNDAGAKKGSYPITGTTAASVGEIPFFQILACKRNDAGQAEPDGYATATLAFFDSESCPENWMAAVDAEDKAVDGYFLVPFEKPAEGAVGKLYGTGYSNEEKREHTHSIASSISLSTVQYDKLIDATHCDSLTGDGEHDFSGASEGAFHGVPYTQLLLCERMPNSDATNPPSGVPTNLVASFNEYECADGWKSSGTGAGRFFVGLPDGGTEDQAFGANPLQAPGDHPTHTHKFSGSTSISYQEIEAAKGSDSPHFGRADTKDYSGTSASGDFDLPYMVTANCQPCVEGDSNPECQQSAN